MNGKGRCLCEAVSVHASNTIEMRLPIYTVYHFCVFLFVYVCCRASAVAGRNYLRAEESKSINLSLSALGNCIAALSSSSQGGSSSAEWRAGGTGLQFDRDRVRHIPYRDSKLTRLLQVTGSVCVSICLFAYLCVYAVMSYQK